MLTFSPVETRKRIDDSWQVIKIWIYIRIYLALLLIFIRKIIVFFIEYSLGRMILEVCTTLPFVSLLFYSNIKYET